MAKDRVREKNEKVLNDLIEQCDGVMWSFSEAIPQLIYFDKKQRRRMPWNCDLEIGQSFFIKIAAYIYVSETKRIIDLLQINLHFSGFYLASRGKGNWFVEASRSTW